MSRRLASALIFCIAVLFDRTILSIVINGVPLAWIMFVHYVEEGGHYRYV